MKYTNIIGFLLVFSSCEKLVLGTEPTNNPEENFEILWNDLDQHYSLFTVRKTNWDSLYNVYRPQINSNTNDAQLWTTCTKIIEHLDDSHTVLFGKNDEIRYISGYTINEQSKSEFSNDVITNYYLDYRTKIEKEKELSYGKIKNKDIGYIYLGAEYGQDPSKIDDILQNLKQHKAIILDVRQNKGGDDKYGERIAGAFADNEQMIYTVQTRNGPNHNDFDAKTEHFSKKQGPYQFVKPVIVLTDRRTISAGEVFLMHLKSFSHVTQIGDTTAGDFSDVGNRRFLPNGWSFQYSIKMYLLPNGQSLDGIGHIPNVYIRNTPADIASNTDQVIEKAIDYLWIAYGIE